MVLKTGWTSFTVCGKLRRLVKVKKVHFITSLIIILFFFLLQIKKKNIKQRARDYSLVTLFSGKKEPK